MTYSLGSFLGQAAPRMRAALPPIKVGRGTWDKARGKYKGVKLIGQGSFGKAFSAKKGKQAVIVKVAFGFPGEATMEEAYEALRKEVKILGKLQKYPFIPRLVEVGPDYFVQEDVGGESMMNLLEKKGLEAQEILAVVVASGIMLSMLHREGIAHRDPHPGNLLLTPRGAVLIDFGIASEKFEGPSIWKKALKDDILLLMENVALAASATDIPRSQKVVLTQILNKFQRKVLENDVDERTAAQLSQ